MFLVGLTGGIASGKSTVSKRLMYHGCQIIDADMIAREVVEPGRPAWKQIKAHFGTKILHEDGTLNRARLGEIIFNDEKERKHLNSITHPAIYKLMLWKAFYLFISGHQFAVMDLPLLFESGAMARYMSYIVVVSCSSEIQLERLMARNNYNETEAKSRIDSQMPLVKKCQLATCVIDNNGSIENTHAQVDKLVEQLKQSRKHWVIRFGASLTLGAIAGLVYAFTHYIIF